MKRLHLIIGVVILVAIAVPAVALAQITYNSGFQVQNLDAANEATIQVDFYNQDGSLAASATYTVTAGGSRTFFPLEDVGTGFNGSVVISSDRDIRAIANVLGNGLDYGASYSGFTAGATTAYAPLLMYDNSGFNTWFNVQNTGSAATDVTVTYSDGVVVQCTNLQPGAACTLDQTTEGHASGWVGSATITAGEPIAVAVMEVGSATLFGYSGFTGGAPDIAIPLVNANNSGYVTGIQIQNMGAVSTTVTLHFEPGEDGTACDETLDVMPGESTTFALYAFTSGGVCGDQRFVGGAEVTANSAGVDLVAIVNQLNLGDNKAAAYEAFDPAAGTTSVIMPLIMDRNGGYFTGFNVFNAGTATTNVTCTFSDSGYTENFALDPGEAYTAYQYGVIGEGYAGSATCTSDGQPIIGVVNELGLGYSGDTFLVYSAFNQ